MNITLAPMQETTISQVGKTVVFLKGDGELLISANDSRARIKSGSQVSFDRFSSVTFQNFSDSAQTFEVLIVEGEYRSLTEGSTVKADVVNPEDVSRPIVLALSETLKTQLTNASDVTNPIVQALAQELLVGITNSDEISGPIVQALAQELLVGITNGDEISGPIVQALGRVLSVDINDPTNALEPVLELLSKKSMTIQPSELALEADTPQSIPSNTRDGLKIRIKTEGEGVVLVQGMPYRNNEIIDLTRFIGSLSFESVGQSATVYVWEFS